MAMYGDKAKEELYQNARYVQEEYGLSEAKMAQLLAELAAYFAEEAVYKEENS